MNVRFTLSEDNLPRRFFPFFPRTQAASDAAARETDLLIQWACPSSGRASYQFFRDLPSPNIKVVALQPTL